MAQVSFLKNYNYYPVETYSMAGNSFYLYPFNIWESISLLTINFPMEQTAAATGSHTVSLGLYQMNNSTLTLLNSGSSSFAHTTSDNFWVSITSFSSQSSLITPGSYWFGLLISTSSQNSLAWVGNNVINAGNAWPGGFYAGRMTTSTNAVPGSIATSDLDITGNDGIFSQVIIISG